MRVIISRWCNFFLWRAQDWNGPHGLTLPVSFLFSVTLPSHPLQSFALGDCGKWVLPCAVEKCTALELLKKVVFLSVDHQWNGRRHVFCQQLLWIFGRTGTLSFGNSCFFYTLLRRLPDACFCCAKKLGSVRAGATYSQLLLPSWEQSLQKCYFWCLFAL